MRPFTTACALSLAATALLMLHSRGLAQAAPRTTLSQPTVRIGEADGDSAYLLFGASQALRTGDGRIIVINHGTSQIREYDSAGRHVRTLGRQGGGPGEFRMLQRIGLIGGDSIAAYDAGNGRITVFAPDGRVARSATVQPFGNSVLPRGLGFTRGGGLLVRTDFNRVFRPGSSRDTVHLAVTDPAGAPVDTLGSYPAEEAFVMLLGGPGGAATRRPVLFGRDLYVSARGERLIIGSSDEFSFDVYFAGGRSRRTYRLPHTMQRVSRDELNRARRAALETVHPRIRADVEPRIGEFPHRETHPAYQDLVAGVDGTIWVQHFAPPGTDARRWTVFGADGRPQREVAAAMPLRIVDAGADYALASSRDEFGIERILLFELPPLR